MIIRKLNRGLNLINHVLCAVGSTFPFTQQGIISEPNDVSFNPRSMWAHGREKTRSRELQMRTSLCA